MKELFIYVLVAIGCAAGTVWLILQGNAEWGISEKWIFPDIIAFIHQNGYSVKPVFLFSFFAFYLLTGLHRYLARGVFKLVIWIIIAAVVFAAGVALFKLLLLIADHL